VHEQGRGGTGRPAFFALKQQGVWLCYMFLMTPPVLSKVAGYGLLGVLLLLFGWPVIDLLGGILPALLLVGLVLYGVKAKKEV
jgi:hypothetical protein